MLTSLNAPEVQKALNQFLVSIPGAKTLTPSPADWRDCWIYFLMVDRFNNPSDPPKQLPFDKAFGDFQGGTFEGMRQKLGYLKELGVGAIWFTPVLFNSQFLNGNPNGGVYHGYGIENFLAIDPRFASDPAHAEEELIRFVDEAHALGLYVIFDIVLNHTGDVFAYPGLGDSAPGRSTPYPINWRDEKGHPRADWSEASSIPANEGVLFPTEMRNNNFFRRQGSMPIDGEETRGDFSSLKQMLTANPELGNLLIRCYQYLIARFDIDGYRIDTLKYLDAGFALTFGNAMREFALSVGKKNFFTYGEVYDGEAKISQFIGRNISASGKPSDLVGVDASLDFPLFFVLPGVAKGSTPPIALADMYEFRKSAEKGVISSHGEATRFFVTFLDNHDQKQRFYFSSPSDPHRFDNQATLGFACLFSLPGIPCLYYGTEQAFHHSGSQDLDVREALWGKNWSLDAKGKPVLANEEIAFDTKHPFFQAVRQLSQVRNEQAALRYGRFYFRPLSGDRFHFGVSNLAPGVLAFSRILNDKEVLIVANTNTTSSCELDVLVDSTLNPLGGKEFKVLYSNVTAPVSPGALFTLNHAEVREVDGSISNGAVRCVPVKLSPMEVQILGKPLSP